MRVCGVRGEKGQGDGGKGSMGAVLLTVSCVVLFLPPLLLLSLAVAAEGREVGRGDLSDLH